MPSRFRSEGSRRRPLRRRMTKPRRRFQNRQCPHGMAYQDGLRDCQLIDQPNQEISQITNGGQRLNFCPAMTR